MNTEFPNVYKQYLARSWSPFWMLKKLPDKISLIKNWQPPNGIRNKNNVPQIHWSKINVIPYDYQRDAINSILKNWSGILHAPTWSGKTIMIADIISRISVKTLIIMKWLTLMNQMKSDLLKVIPDYKISMLSSKKKQDIESDVTIISIASRHNLIGNFDLVIVDECDQFVFSDDIRNYVSHIPCKYFYWLTATKDVNHMDPWVIESMFWPTTRVDIQNFSPKIICIHTPYINMDVWWSLSEFSELKQNLYSDQRRNDIIVEVVKKSLMWRKWILITEHVEHAKEIVERMKWLWIKTHLIIWEINDEERERIRLEIDESSDSSILIGSRQIISRWFNCPSLSIWYLTSAEWFTSNVAQQIWRIVRKSPWKEWCTWIDFCDTNCQPLKFMHKKRISAYKKYYPESNIFHIYDYDKAQ